MFESSNKMSSIDFTHFYHNILFQKNATDKIADARIKRMQVISNTLECIKCGDRAASRSMAENHVAEYFQVIDERNGINNYADYIKALYNKLPKPTTNCSQWKSNFKNLKNANEIVEDLYMNMKSIDEKKVDDYVLWEMKLSIQKKIHLDKVKNESERIQSSDVDLHEKLSSVCSTENVPSFTRSECQRPAAFPLKENANKFSAFQPGKSITSTKSFQDSKNRYAASVQKNTDSIQAGKIPGNSFRTARTEMTIQNSKKYSGREIDVSMPKETVCVKRSLGSRPRSVNSKFIPPIKNINLPEEDTSNAYFTDENYIEDERLKNLDPKMIELIKNEIMDQGNHITWDDISGLEFAKNTIQEIVVWPLLRPDIFTGLRRPPKGILLFGPPGTGKTLIGKCIASQSSSTFFSISASSLTSKWIGESEKLVRTLFVVARCHQPAVIFIDEIDSLLSQRNETEHESSRRIKTEFLVQLDGATTHEDDRILVIGATNRPQELDEAARRRLVKRLYIPLPEFDARRQIVHRLMSTEKNDLTKENVDEIARLTEGYSGADMKNLCQEASLGPIRSIDFRFISSIESGEVRPVTFDDFKTALKVVRSSISPADLNQYLEWDKIYGSRGN